MFNVAIQITTTLIFPKVSAVVRDLTSGKHKDTIAPYRLMY
jgi:hypothetical protein